MVFRRRVAKRKQMAKRKLYRKKSPYAMSKIYRFKRINKTCIIQNSSTANTITTDDTSQVNLSGVTGDTVGSLFTGSMAFALNNVQNATDFSGLYDQYKIRGAKVTFTPLSTEGTFGTLGAYAPTLYWYQDMDDTAVPTAVEVRQHQNIKIAQLVKPRSIFVSYPKANVDLGAPTPSTAGIMNTWLDCNSTLISHNGLKFMVRNANLSAQPGNIWAIRVDVTYYLQFKNPQ